MKSRPILFSGAMIRAILGGSKTQTRRVLKGMALDWISTPTGFDPQFIADAGNRLCPYGNPGDQLWVREAWRTSKIADELKPSQLVGGSCSPIWYEAQEEVPFHSSDFGKLRPSMFMPRWASRITLEITGVRVERLQDITPEDCIAEGVSGSNSMGRCDLTTSYADLWKSINGPGSWDLNPWVWVIEFRRLP